MRLIPLLALLPAALAIPSSAQPVADLPAFTAIALSNGGHVLLRHGETQRVTIVEGRPGLARIRVEGGRLLVGRCERCPHRDRLRVEVTAPRIDRLAVAHGGTLETAGRFPAQAALAATVEHGGTIDLRAMRGSSVDAAIDQGGRILARPGAELTASVNQGGNVTYWGDPAVSRSVRGGGAVEKGRPADSARPLSELGGPLPPLPALPRLPHPPGSR